MAATAPPSCVDPVDVLPRLRLDLVGQRLDEVRPGQRVDGVDDAGLVGDDLLGAQRDARRPLGRQPERFVEAVGVQALRPPSTAASGLDRDADDVVLGLLRGERRAAGLGVEAQHQEFASLAPKRSVMIRAHMRRAARNLATSSKKSLWAFQKNDRRGAKSSTSRPASMAAST